LMSRILNATMPEIEDELVVDVELDDGPKEEVGACACSSARPLALGHFVYLFLVTIVYRRRVLRGL